MNEKPQQPSGWDNSGFSSSFLTSPGFQYADRKGSFLSSLRYLKKDLLKYKRQSPRGAGFTRHRICAAPDLRGTGLARSHHFHTVSPIDHSKSRSQGNNISLPPITKLTLFYLVLHICSYKYVQPNLFVVFCIESIQNTTKLLCLAFPKKR